MDGHMVTGWRTIDGEVYYFEPDREPVGSMATGLVQIDGVWMEFDEDGHLDLTGNSAIAAMPSNALSTDSIWEQKAEYYKQLSHLLNEKQTDIDNIVEWLEKVTGETKFAKENAKLLRMLENSVTISNDIPGLMILMHYLYGGGTLIKEEDGYWADYMKRNIGFRDKVRKQVYILGQELKKGDRIRVNKTFYAGEAHGAIFFKDGERMVGYDYFHGPEYEAGGFVVQGYIEKAIDGSTIYELKYTWNDNIDPEFMYTTDRYKAVIGNLVSFGQAKPYIIKILWHDTSILTGEEDNKNERWIEGWLSDK